MFQVHQWQRDTRNPIFPPQESFDISACMNPFVLRRDDEYWMYYAGGDKDGFKRICLAICPVDDLTQWQRLGPLFEVGEEGAFDEWWCVLPCLHRFKDRWHLYYTGRSRQGEGLQSFGGIGLATSGDLLNWTKFSSHPVLNGGGFEHYPQNRGIAGGGSIIETRDAQNRLVYRMYYTLAVGTPSKDLLVDQEKHTACAHSYDGLEWFDRHIVLSPRREADYENAAAAALKVWETASGLRAIYAGIGTRFGAYSMCEAQSADGFNWERGGPDENLTMPPSAHDGNGQWADKMCEYPTVVEEDNKLRLFYCGNGYGKTGIGTAIAEPLAELQPNAAN